MADAKPAAGGPKRPPGPKLTALLTPYRPFVAAIVCLTIAANGLNLFVPKLIAVSAVFLVALPWILQLLVKFTTELFRSIPQLAG